MKGKDSKSFQEKKYNQNPRTRDYGIIGDKIFISVYVKVDQNMRKEQNVIKKVKKAEFGFMMIALTCKGLRRCHFCPYNKKNI